MTQNKLFFLSSLIFLSVFATGIQASLPILPAQIIARDLDIPGYGGVGHVGVTAAPVLIMDAFLVYEVLNETPVIQVNTIDNFKTRSRYWGSRYGISDRGAHAIQLLREGSIQRCLGAEYTTFSISWPATGDSSSYPSCNTTRLGQFRCDTYVNYIFGVAGYYLPVNGKTLPNIIFNSFPYGNGDGPYALQSTPSLYAMLTPSIIKSQDSINTITAQQLEQMSLEEFMAIVDVPGNNMGNKLIKKIWGFSLDPALNMEKRILLVDYLGGIAKVDMIPKFIAQYSKIDDQKLKSMLLRDIQNVYQSCSTLDSVHLYEKGLLQKFYSNLLDKNLSAHDSEMAVRGFINLNSNSTILANINKINLLLNKINPYTRIGLKTNLSLKVKELEIVVIPEIISLLTREDNSQLDERFFLYVIDNLSRGIDRLSPELKNMISTYMYSVKYKYDSLMTLNQGTSMFGFGAWLEASALVNTDSLKDAGNYVANFIGTRKKVNEQESYVIGLSSRAYMKNAFNTEPVLIKFKRQRKAVYMNTVGVTAHR